MIKICLLSVSTCCSGHLCHASNCQAGGLNGACRGGWGLGPWICLRWSKLPRSITFRRSFIFTYCVYTVDNTRYLYVYVYKSKNNIIWYDIYNRWCRLAMWNAFHDLFQVLDLKDHKISAIPREAMRKLGLGSGLQVVGAFTHVKA